MGQILAQRCAVIGWLDAVKVALRGAVSGAARALRARAAVDDPDPAKRIAASGYFAAADVGWISDTYFNQGTGPGTTWDRALRDAHMTLPDWFSHGLDPLGEAYAAQQHRLWQLVTGIDRPYEPELDEKEHDWSAVDPVRRPGFYARRDPQALGAAADHLFATAMLLKHCGLKPGNRALEYGAGFGHTALALARLGVQVDTVDISTVFCDFVRRQAEFFEVPLTPFQGQFGVNPRPGQHYDVIWFYESFHHCVDFIRVVRELNKHLAEGGRVILGGEPIVEFEYDAVPYPWGVRLHSEVAAVMHRQRWFELGFSEDFLFELFTAAGFVASRIDCPSSLFGRLYVFERRPETIQLRTLWLPPVYTARWGEPTKRGRYSGKMSSLPLDTTGDYEAVEVTLSNPSLRQCRIEMRLGDASVKADLQPGGSRRLCLPAVGNAKPATIEIECSMPGWRPLLGNERAGRARHGVVVEAVRYLREGAGRMQ